MLLFRDSYMLFLLYSPVSIFGRIISKQIDKMKNIQRSLDDNHILKKRHSSYVCLSDSIEVTSSCKDAWRKTYEDT
jgi:hypothetical protein